ncbi:MAG TPA: tetratricopeptide repeat protein [Pyrinomonadaceae bacterium]
MKRPATFLFAALWLLLPLCASAADAAAAERWISVRSQNFLLVGNASEKETARVAAHLEQFREVFSQLLPEGRHGSSVPLVIIVFKDDKSYGPFKPLSPEPSAGVAGYFQSGQDVDYITLSADEQHDRGTHALAFHEYVHLLVKNNFRRAPLWFNEGLAEYYGTFRISNNGKTVTVGEPVRQHLRTLSEHELLPLATLFAVNSESPHYNKPDKRIVYYAQSWALVHYLLNGKGGERRPQVSRYLELLRNGTQVDEAFRQAFQTEFGTIERELQQYVRFGLYSLQATTLSRPLRFDVKVESAALSEARTQFYLGDLLLHINQPEAAAQYLQRAVALDPKLAGASISLGLIRLREDRLTEAKQHFERAVAADSANFLAHYYYAYAISRETPDNLAEAHAPEAVAIMRAELKKAIELGPGFPESYYLLATINLAMNEKLDETLALISQALKLWPDQQRFTLQLAEAHLRREELSAARGILETLLRGLNSGGGGAGDGQLMARAQSLLSSLAFVEATARLKAQDEAEEAKGAIARQPCDAPQPGPQLKKLRFEGEQACGRLVRVECLEGKVMLFVEVEGRTLKLGSDALNHIRFVTYTTEARGKMECGLREPANPVLVTYRAPKNTAFNIDGEVIAVEFVPADWTR